MCWIDESLMIERYEKMFKLSIKNIQVNPLTGQCDYFRETLESVPNHRQCI